MTKKASNSENLELRHILESVLNTKSRENASNTPDFILAEYMLNCLEAYEKAVLARAIWFGRIDSPGEGSIPYLGG